MTGIVSDNLFLILDYKSLFVEYIVFLLTGREYKFPMFTILIYAAIVYNETLV